MRKPISRWTSVVAMALGVGVIGGSVIGGIALAAGDGPEPNPAVSESHHAAERDDSGADGVDDHDDDSRGGYDDSDSDASDRDDDSDYDDRGDDSDDDSDDVSDDVTAAPTPSSDDDHPDDD